jgi:hypothetical protein
MRDVIAGKIVQPEPAQVPPELAQEKTSVRSLNSGLVVVERKNPKKLKVATAKEVAKLTATRKAGEAPHEKENLASLLYNPINWVVLKNKFFSNRK